MRGRSEDQVRIPPRVAGIVLAAGRSRRMGQQKLLLPLGGQPVIRRIVDTARKGPLDPLIVVTSAQGEAVGHALTGTETILVPNPAEDGDMLSSVRCGLTHVPAGCSAVLVLLGDQPGVTTGLIFQLVEAHERTGASIVVPSYDGTRGHPVLIHLSHRQEIMHEFDGVGLRGLLHSHRDSITEVSVASPELLEDMDLPEDYARISQRLSSGSAR